MDEQNNSTQQQEFPCAIRLNPPIKRPLIDALLTALEDRKVQITIKYDGDMIDTSQFQHLALR